MEEKKELNVEEIEEQALLELPDRSLPYSDIVTNLLALIFNLGGGGGGGAGGSI